MKILEKISPVLSGVILNFPEAILIADGESNILFANQAAASMFGYSQVALTRATLDLILPSGLSGKHKGHVKGFVSKKQTARQMGQNLYISGRIKGGKEFPAEASITHLGKIDGKEAAMVVMKDISGRFPTPELIDLYLGKTPGKDVLSAFDQLKDSVVMVDSEWRYRYANREALRRLDRPRSKIIGQSIWELNPHILGTPFEKMARECMTDHIEREVEDFYPQSGYWYRTRFIPSEKMLVLHISDVTELKKAQESSKRLTAALEQALDNNWGRKDYRDPHNKSW